MLLTRTHSISFAWSRGRCFATVHRPSTSVAGKVYLSAQEAVADVQSGSTVLSGGFGLCGTPDTLIGALAERVGEVNDLIAVSNNAGAGDHGLARLLRTGQISRIIASYIGTNKAFERMYLTGKLDVELTPQGTLVERIRAGAAGIPAFYTPTGAGTPVQDGTIVKRYDEGGKPIAYSKEKESRLYQGRPCILEEAIQGDVALIRAWKADELGNLVFRYTAQNFSAAMAKNASQTLVEVDEILPAGSLNPMEIHVPGIYVDRIIQSSAPKLIEFAKLRDNNSTATSALDSNRLKIAQRAAAALQDGSNVNLGIGLPMLVPEFLPKDRRVWVQSENGIIGMGPYPSESELDPDIINAGKESVTLLPGAATFDSVDSFAMIRGGHLDVSILGAMEVSAEGDLANWMVPGHLVKGMGGAMDLVSSPDRTKIIVLTDHCDKKGRPKIVQKCKLPLTGAKCVSTIITDMAVFEVDRKAGCLILVELMPGITLEDVANKTEAAFDIHPDLKTSL